MTNAELLAKVATRRSTDPNRPALNGRSTTRQAEKCIVIDPRDKQGRQCGTHLQVIDGGDGRTFCHMHGYTK